MEKGDVFTNKDTVNEATTSRNRLVDGLLERLNVLVREYKAQVVIMTAPEQLPQKDIKIDMNTDNKDKLVVVNGVITARPGLKVNGSYSSIPAFLKEPIQMGQSFIVEVIEAADRRFTIGVAPADLKNTINKHNSKDSHCLHAGGVLFSNSKYQPSSSFELKTGDKVTVRRSTQRSWFRDT